MRLNQRQREHIARGLQAIAIGQLAYFGYHMITAGKFGWLVSSLVLYVVIEAYAIFLLRNLE